MSGGAKEELMLKKKFDSMISVRLNIYKVVGTIENRWFDRFGELCWCNPKDDS